MIKKSSLFFSAVLLLSLPALAGKFAVVPIRLELGAAAKSGFINVRNDDEEKLTFQVEALEWSQNEKGEDQYKETQDIIFFPKILNIEAGKQGLIRVANRVAVTPSERTYRLFISETQGPIKKNETAGAQINILIRFGAPIFMLPAKPRDGLELEDLQLIKNMLSFSANNSGNRHQIVEALDLKGLDAQGNTLWTHSIKDRYLLNGSRKPYSAEIEAGQCVKISRVTLFLKTDRRTAEKELAVDKSMCS